MLGSLVERQRHSVRWQRMKLAYQDNGHDNEGEDLSCDSDVKDRGATSMKAVSSVL